MQVIECSEWAATVQVGEQMVVIEVPEAKREAARYSVDLRPYVSVQTRPPLAPATLEHARDVGLVAMLGKQRATFS